MTASAWVEAWLDEASGGDYVLLLRGYEDELRLTDPQQGGRVVQTFRTYAEATAWLNEDEYELIEGRWLLTRH